MHIIFVFFLAAVSSVLMDGGSCQAASPPSRTPCGLCEEQDRFVHLQVRPIEPRSQHPDRYVHPVRLTPEEWAQVLGRIRVQSQPEGFLFGRTQGPILDAFTADDIQFLSTALSKAFAEARPEEVVVFGLAHSRAPKLDEITTGGWFISGETLFLVLANYHTAVTLPGIRALLWEDPLRKQAGLPYELVPGEYQTLVQRQDDDAPLFATSPSSRIAIQYRAILRQPLPSEAPSEISPISPEATHPLEERLTRLRRLWESGLITEDEYRSKRKELLDRL